MNTIRYSIAALAVAAGAGGFWAHHRADAKEAPSYRLAAVERGSIQATVSATGKLQAVRTVQVGTQVSGQVAAIYVDFNDRVTRGQLIARIDPTLQRQAVAEAQAGLERNQASLQQAQREYDRSKQLFDAKMVTESEFGTVQSTLAIARANVKAAQVALDRARQNLAYTNIYAPIDGIVVERNVELGQTVAASLSAPQLFLIANDLSRMQILANVDESDIGQIREGQTARFTVQSYASDNFSGIVKQVRLQSTTTDNVVNYTAVVEVRNPGAKLLPGMTATVDFVTGASDSALVVPNAALRYRPTAAQLAAAGIDSASLTARRDSARPRTAGAQATTQGTGAARDAGRTAGATQRRGGGGLVWYLDPTGKLAFARVRTGLSDGQKTAVQSRQLEQGMKVIVGTSSGAAPAAATSGTANPFQPQRGPAGGRPGGI